MTTKNNILIYRLGSLGDILVSLPAIIEIRNNHPTSKIHLISNNGGDSLVSAKEILKNSSLVDEFIQYKTSTITQIIKLALGLRKINASQLYYLAPYRSRYQSIRDAIFFKALVGVPLAIGLKSQSARATTLNAMCRTERESQRLLDIVNPRGDVDSFFNNPKLAIDKSLIDKAVTLFTSESNNTRHAIISITPGSKMPSKRWPVERYIVMINELLKSNKDALIVLLGSPDEAPLTKHIHDRVGDKCIDLAGKTSLDEAKAILSLSQLYVGNDTGTMHLAAAVGTRCVAIFSSRDVPGKWEPYGKEHIILRADVPCAGCLLDICDRDMVCLTKISVDAVLAAVANAVEPEWGARLKTQLMQR